MSSLVVLRIGLLLILVALSNQQSSDGLDEVRETLDQRKSEINAILVQSLQRSNSLAHQAIAEINVDRDSVQQKILQAYTSTDVRGNIRSVAQKAILWTREFGTRKMRRVNKAEVDIEIETDRTSQIIYNLVCGTSSAPIVSNALRRIQNLLVQSVTKFTLLTRQIVNNTIRIAQLVSLKAIRISRLAHQYGSSAGYLQDQLKSLVLKSQSVVRRHFTAKDQKIQDVYDKFARNALHEIEPSVAISNYISDTQSLDEDDDEEDFETQ